MNLDIEQARSSLTEIERVMRQTRRDLAMRGTGTILMVWGLVWTTCFALTHFYPLQYRWVWGLGNAIGILATMLAVRRTVPVVTGPSERRMTWKFFWLWMSLVAFINASIAIMFTDGAGPGQKISAFIALGIMFVYIVIGLMLDATLMIGLGLAVAQLFLPVDVGHQRTGHVPQRRLRPPTMEMIPRAP
jgi:hypothetical protein